MDERAENARRGDPATGPAALRATGKGPGGFRLYSDLSWLWPLWGDATEEYARYCEHVTRLVRAHARRPVATLLDVGCGGGKNLFNLGRQFRVTGLDLSPAMVAQARALNPGCEVVEGDMRTFALGRTFDAVLMDDAISFMDDRDDFAAAFRNAWAHLAPGGVMVATPDVTRETFVQNRTTSTPAASRRKPPGVDVVFVENVYDPDPTDERYEATMLYLIREEGALRVEVDRYSFGLFSLDTWRSVLAGTGFEVGEGRYADGEDEWTVFACVKPVDGEG
jgi:SAM-dependent methyltransferase